MFIELTELNGNKFIGNINELKRVFITSEGKTAVSGWNNNGYFEVQEDYDDVIDRINLIQSADYLKRKVLRIYDN
jgi:uncharacterized protein YlzI (FlbEa/FlbD family)